VIVSDEKRGRRATALKGDPDTRQCSTHNRYLKSLRDWIKKGGALPNDPRLLQQAG
jgi:hypothetical protein